MFGNILFSQDLRNQCCEYETNNRQWLSYYTNEEDLVAFDQRVTNLYNPEEYGSFIELSILFIHHL